MKYIIQSCKSEHYFKRFAVQYVQEALWTKNKDGLVEALYLHNMMFLVKSHITHLLFYMLVVSRVLRSVFVNPITIGWQGVNGI